MRSPCTNNVTSVRQTPGSSHARWKEMVNSVNAQYTDFAYSPFNTLSRPHSIRQYLQKRSDMTGRLSCYTSSFREIEDNPTMHPLYVTGSYRWPNPFPFVKVIRSAVGARLNSSTLLHGACHSPSMLSSAFSVDFTFSIGVSFCYS